MNDTRHLSLDGFKAHLATGVPIDHPISGHPRLVLFIDPISIRVGLRGPAGSRAPRATGLEHLRVQTVHLDGMRYVEITVSDASLFIDAYPLLCAIADRVQIDGYSVIDALDDALRSLGHLLRPEDTLARESEIGLLGELALLAGLIPTIGAANAVAAWRGGQAEEHDFGLDTEDLEVKTTTSERRSHWISALTQLVPTGDRPLSLLSVQITKAGIDGWSLPDLIDRVRVILEDNVPRQEFDERVRSAGWRERYAATCAQRWRLRTPPATYGITDGFPRLIPSVLQRAGVDLIYIPQIRYQVDLTGLAKQSASAQVGAAISAIPQELH